MGDDCDWCCCCRDLDADHERSDRIDCCCLTTLLFYSPDQPHRTDVHDHRRSPVGAGVDDNHHHGRLVVPLVVAAAVDFARNDFRNNDYCTSVPCSDHNYHIDCRTHFDHHSDAAAAAPDDDDDVAVAAMVVVVVTLISNFDHHH